jgi:hypothetical protein
MIISNKRKILGTTERQTEPLLLKYLHAKPNAFKMLGVRRYALKGEIIIIIRKDAFNNIIHKPCSIR